MTGADSSIFLEVNRTGVFASSDGLRFYSKYIAREGDRMIDICDGQKEMEIKHNDVQYL